MVSYATLFEAEVINLEEEEKVFASSIYLSHWWCQGGDALRCRWEGCRGTLIIECLLYFFPGLSIGLKQSGIAPCITPFSSIEWRHMERRYIWLFLLTWRLESCALLYPCDSSHNYVRQQAVCTLINKYLLDQEILNPGASESLYSFSEKRVEKFIHS